MTFSAYSFGASCFLLIFSNGMEITVPDLNEITFITNTLNLLI